MLLLKCMIGFILCFGFCSSSPLLICEKLVQSGLNEEIKGTLYEKGGSSCDAFLNSSVFDDPSTYTKVYLIPRDKNENHTEIIFGNLTSFFESGFDVNRHTKLLIHGWLEYVFDGFVTSLTNSYFEAPVEDFKILTVDWSATADLLYPMARLCVEPVGAFLAEFVDWLVTQARVNIDFLHIIGLSLGAHVAGVVGEKSTVGKVGRITGLDPAGPMFGPSLAGRLDSTDAQFVDIIHTCGHWAGYYKASGHVDFYPNGGEFNQPGCNPLDLGVCSHKRSYHLFNESISDLGFSAIQCNTWNDLVSGKCNGNNSTVMGEHVDPRSRGTFYLFTTDSYPFAINSSYASNVH